MLCVRLFGSFEASLHSKPVKHLPGRVQELFCYLLLHRDVRQPRERLAGVLWSNRSTSRSKKHLRQTLWQLQAELASVQKCLPARLLAIEDDWICLRSAGIWLDVAIFERAFTMLGGGSVTRLPDAAFELLQEAAGMYRGDLLQGFYQDWCRSERDRLQSMYLSLLERLMSECEARRRYELGLTYGYAALRCDPAYESIHQRMMRLHYLAGNRAGALRQYDRCVKALKQELGIAPTAQTVHLCGQIRADSMDGFYPSGAAPAGSPAAPLVDEALGRIEQIRNMLREVENELRQKTQAAEADARPNYRPLPKRLARGTTGS